MLHDPNIQIHFADLLSSVLPIKPMKFQHNYGHGRKAKVKQFPVTLAYAITDYKCQGKAFQYVIVDLKNSSRGSSPHTSAYVQLPRATVLDRVSIMRPFDVADLTAPLPQELHDELDWQDEMVAKSRLIL
jgi:hypothetical protein